MKIYGYELHGGINAGPETNAVSKLKQFIEILQRWHFGSQHLSMMPGDEWLCSIEFGMNLAVLRKCTEQDMREQPVNVKTGGPFEPQEVEKWLQMALSSNPVGG